MKESLRSYFTFHRGQRMGLLILMGLLVILISWLAIMHSRAVPRTVKTTIDSHIPVTMGNSRAVE